MSTTLGKTPQISDTELIGCLVLGKVPRLSEANLKHLLEVFGSAHAILSSSSEELQSKGQLSEKAVCALQEPSLQDWAHRELQAVRRIGGDIIPLTDPRYPRALSAIADPPILLYIYGEFRVEDQQAVAIVGSRQASPYGIRTAEQIAGELAAWGLTIVSGLARGIDSAAHRGALAGGGRTIAVLGCGLDICYPPESSQLMKEIIERGAVITEFPLGMPPKPGHFPRRNRVISGLSLGTLVVEATERSGSLITARSSLDQGREVFAVPGNLGAPGSRGTNRLIQSGAKLIQQAHDILDELKPQMEVPTRIAARKDLPTLEPQEAELLEFLSDEPQHIDELITKSRLPSASIHTLLLGLELKGLVKQLSGQFYVHA